jgi:pantoate--beta-alanine ligase
MGALHAGHLSLIHAAKAHSDIVIASIFVNPKQFAAGEDFSRYPRTLAADIEMLSQAGVDAVFIPEAQMLYPSGFSTQILTSGMDNVLCGAHRQGHFAGVTTIVGLLFALVRPDYAFFGEKDYQQLAIIRRMNQDIPLAGEVIAVPTMREPDGLALSSRNRYLNAEERALAPMLYQQLQHIAECSTDASLQSMIAQSADILTKAGFALDYLEARMVDSLALAKQKAGARLFIAARLGTTRLIDNLSLDTTLL